MRKGPVKSGATIAKGPSNRLESTHDAAHDGQALVQMRNVRNATRRVDRHHDLGVLICLAEVARHAEGALTRLGLGADQRRVRRLGRKGDVGILARDGL